MVFYFSMGESVHGKPFKKTRGSPSPKKQTKQIENEYVKSVQVYINGCIK